MLPADFSRWTKVFPYLVRFAVLHQVHQKYCRGHVGGRFHHARRDILVRADFFIKQNRWINRVEFRVARPMSHM